MNPYGPKVIGKVDWKRSHDNGVPEKVVNVVAEKMDGVTFEQDKLSTPAVGNHITTIDIVLSAVVIAGVIWLCKWCLGTKSRNTPASSERSMRDLIDRL